MSTEEKVAKLSIIIDSSQAESAANSLDRLAISGKSAEDRTRKITSEAKKAAAPLKGVSEAVKSTSDSFESVSVTGKKAAKNIEEISKETPKTSKSLNDISKSTKTISGNLNEYVSHAGEASGATSKINKEFVSASSNFNNFSNSAQKASISFGGYVSTSKDASKLINEYNKNLGQLVPNLDTSSKFVSKIGGEFGTFGTSIKNAGYSSGKFSQDIQKINQTGTVAIGNLRTASDELKTFGDSAQIAGAKASTGINNVSRVSIDVKSAMSELASSLLPIASVSGAIAGLNQLKNEAMDFQTAIAQVSTILDDNANLGEISDSAKEAALEFGKMPTEQVKAFYDILSAGIESTADAQKILIAGNKLAIGGSADFNIATKGIISTLNTYGIEAERVAEVTDGFFIAAKAGALNIEDLSAGIGNIASIAQPAGVGLDELLASIAALTNTGVTTSQAITNIRSAISSVITPSKQASDAAAEIGIEFNAAALKSKGFTKFMEEIKTKSQGNSEILGRLFGSIEALSGAQALIGPAFEDFNNALDQMGKKSGATEVAFQKMADTAAKQADKLSAKFAILRIEAGEKLLTAIVPAISALNENFEEIVDTAVLAAEITGVYVAAVYGIPVAAAIASKGMFILTSGIQAYISSTTVATAKTITLQNSLNLLAAAFIGWEIGSYLRDNFEVVEKAGIAMASGLHEIAIRLQGNYELLGEKIKIALTDPLSFIKNQFIDFAQDWVDIATGLYRAIGANDLANNIDKSFVNIKKAIIDDNTAALDKIKADTEKSVTEMKDIYAQMFSDVGKSFDDLAKKEADAKKKNSSGGGNQENVPSVKIADPEELKKRAKEIEALNKEYERTVDTYKQQLQSASELTEVEKIRYQLSNTELSKLNDAQKRELLNYAEAIDKIDEINKKKKEQERIDQESLQIQERLDPSKAILKKYNEERKIILESQKLTKEEETKLLTELEKEKNEALLEESDDYWAKWLKTAEDNLMNFDNLTQTVIENFTTGFGNAFEEMIFDSKNLEDAMTSLAENMLRAITNAIGQMIAQWLAYQAIQLISGKATQSAAATQMSANAYAMALQGGINAFASTAAIPIVGPFMAPGALAAAEAILQPMATAVSSLAIAGMAHDGIMNIPQDGTWLLKKGERVTSENTSKKLDRMLDKAQKGMGGQSVNQVFNISTPNADSFRLSERQILKRARRGLQ